MKEFVIIQKKINHFHYQYVAGRKLNIKEINNVRAAMNLYLERGLEITFEKKDRIERSGAGKIKHFYSHLDE